MTEEENRYADSKLEILSMFAAQGIPPQEVEALMRKQIAKEPDAFGDDVLAGWVTEVEACTTHEELAEVMLAIAKAYKQGDPARETLRPVCAKKQAEIAAAEKGAP